jgi:hypothetical protein
MTRTASITVSTTVGSSLLSIGLLLGATTPASAQVPGLGAPMCVDIKGTSNVGAPGTGSITISNLDKYGVPATACTTLNLSADMTSFSFSSENAAATTFNNVTYPSCAGLPVPYTLSGGPVYSYSVANGNLSVAGEAMTGTVTVSGLSQTDNLRISLGGSTYTINSEIESYNATTTFNADGSSDTRICVPPGGMRATLDGAAVHVPAELWQCLATPATDPKFRVHYVNC